MIGILVFPEFQLLDAAGPVSAFEIAGRLSGAPALIRMLAETPGEVRSSSGVAVMARGLRATGGLRTLIVAGGAGVEAAAARQAVQNAVRAAAGRGCRVASVCSGAYVLAAAGLLDGRRATTH